MVRIELSRAAKLEELLRLDPTELSPQLMERLDHVLTNPVDEFLGRPGKTIRGRVVEAGYRLGLSSGTGAKWDAASQGECAVLAECIEAIHAGSLIVDDIQDGTQIRRGSPSLHRTQGLASALNAGNLLYFWGMRHLSSARRLDPATALACSKRLHEELLRAHYGQALDVGVRIEEVPQPQVAGLCLATLRLKSGALMALALALGAIAAGAGPELTARIDGFGHSLGMGLQMFDDINNLAETEPSDPARFKRLEDLRLRRPSWVWAFAAKTCSDYDYGDFIRAILMLPDESFLTAWLGIHDLPRRAAQAAREYVQAAFAELEAGLAPASDSLLALADLKAMAGRICTLKGKAGA